MEAGPRRVTFQRRRLRGSPIRRDNGRLLSGNVPGDLVMAGLVTIVL